MINHRLLHRFGGHNNAACDRVVILVSADLNDLEPTDYFVTLGPVLHPFDGSNDLFVGIAFDRDLRIGGAGQSGVPARPRAVGAAVVDDDDCTFEVIA